VPFIAEGVAADEAVLVVVSDAKIERLRAELDGGAAGVHFADMAVVGYNPARIIPAWRQFLDDNSGDSRTVRGIGEPIWAGRTDDELVECQRHESLLNYAFDGSGDWRLLCPYDTSALSADVISEARATHRYVAEADRTDVSGTYRDAAAEPFERPLLPPPAGTAAFAFDATMLDDARRFVADYAALHDLLPGRSEELVVAVGELITNSVRHGGGAGVVRVWNDHGLLVCEVSDKGWLRNPLAGRERPSTEREEGRGLWMVNHLCDLMQIRSSPAGTVVRVLMG
jgi:anti-sigma regulatory factor (Ser/Thr protein kinase)